ncbi:AbrB/MazE/SpoVT family DNA-binding domain-containing protein [Okeania sp. SIO1I7]|uniref:AbrB/MazE/SpoVT family DNA-binding domain-containing protein n=1 Tax=Okeania sp. SIO1I7 TaxID=2607772 RepID=UPI0013FC1004|nr:type II toxin-antitoxin system PrlF family antitoxin [Okeania sp. SIO1I7]NET26102.1 AbrB/MazE/SpoVT family DNA-binding domain-containing protein [Okeania sp. SIO1I7]
MASTIVSDRGQITIPEEIRDYLKLNAGSKIEFVIDEQGEVKIIPLKFSVEDLSGILHYPGIEKATIEDMENAVQEAAIDWS